MGANQSNSGQKPAQAAAQEVKTSYYELLNVERQATDEEIKKAYRRKALELHPDRNYGDVERTTKLFAEIQTAYQVLSDPQERAWYDSHEEAILRDVDLDAGDSPEAYEHNIGLTSADDISRMLRKFHGGVEFSDAPSGFFGFLRETFTQLGREEELAARREGSTEVDYPSFGHKDDDYDDVVKSFYAIWNGFSTKKTFTWRDKYRSSDAPDRRTRRYIEKENQQFRNEGIREFNEAVRTLVAFVRKRDPRYTPNTQTELEREKVLRDAAAARATKMRAENAAKMDAEVLPAWAKAREPDEVMEDTDEESEEEQFECVACRKTFKSERQFEAHERSKKHVKAVQALRRQLQKEGEALDLDDDGEHMSGTATTVTVPADADEAPILSEEDAHGTEKGAPGYHLEDEAHNASPPSIQNLALSDEEDAYASETSTTSTTPPAALNSSQPETLASHIPNDDHSDTDEPPSQPEIGTPKMGKAAQKRAKKAAAAAAELAEQSLHKCATCSATFPSKTRLFQHISDHGHAAPPPVGAAGGKGKGGKRKK